MLNQMLLLTVFVIDTFRMRNPWFYDLKPRLSDRNLMGFRTWGQYCINMQLTSRRVDKLTSCLIYSVDKVI